MIEKVLSELWFKEKESKIYIAALELWYAPVSTIARKSWVNRITAYTILKDLFKKWIATEFVKNKVQYYSVISPESLLEKTKSSLERLHGIMPDLMAISNLYANKPKIQFFDWVEWLKNIYNDHLVVAQPLYSFLSVKPIPAQLKDYLDSEYMTQRIKKNIPAKVIVSNNTENRNYAKNDKKFLRETLVIQTPVFELDNEIIIYWGDKVSICMFPNNECSWVMIQSKSFHDTLLNIFSLIWESTHGRSS